MLNIPLLGKAIPVQAPRVPIVEVPDFKTALEGGKVVSPTPYAPNYYDSISNVMGKIKVYI